MVVRYRCLVVDDEPLARRVIVKYIEKLPWLQLAAECKNARTAAAYLHKQTVDVMFLDVKMPGLSGFDLLKALPDPPQVILTTAYSEYAVAGYEYSVVDFLLKPISFERFLKAVNKLSPAHVTGRQSQVASSPSTQKDFIFMRADRIDHRVHLTEIRYLEGCGNFIKVHLDQGQILVAKTLAAMEDTLPADRFLRVHRSFIVAMDRVDQYAASFLRIGKTNIPVGRSYRRLVAQVIQGRR
jgi:DNA-binding LytR/AlgR family response regulator